MKRINVFAVMAVLALIAALAIGPPSVSAADNGNPETNIVAANMGQKSDVRATTISVAGLRKLNTEPTDAVALHSIYAPARAPDDVVSTALANYNSANPTTSNSNGGDAIAAYSSTGLGVVMRANVDYNPHGTGNARCCSSNAGWATS